MFLQDFCNVTKLQFGSLGSLIHIVLTHMHYLKVVFSTVDITVSVIEKRKMRKESKRGKGERKGGGKTWEIMII